MNIRNEHLTLPCDNVAQGGAAIITQVGQGAFFGCYPLEARADLLGRHHSKLQLQSLMVGRGNVFHRYYLSLIDFCSG
jgi:hypothetical protein